MFVSNSKVLFFTLISLLMLVYTVNLINNLIQITLLAKDYNHYYDDYIIEALHKHERLSHNELRRIVGHDYLKKSIPYDTFCSHVQKMTENGSISIINKDSFRRGQRIFYTLTEKTRQSMRLGLLNKDYNEGNNQIFKIYPDQLAITYFLTVCILATKGKSLIIDNDDFEMGITVQEILENYGGFFGFDHSWLNKTDVTRVITLLIEEDLVRKNDRCTNCDRFYITVDMLKDFIEELQAVYRHWVFPRLVLYWKNIHPPKPHERIFLDSFYGKKANERIEYFQDILRKKKQEGSYLKNLEARKNMVYHVDSNLKKVFDDILKRYSNLTESCPTISNILLEIFYPQFLQEELENISNKYKDKKPLKAIMITCETTTTSKDNVDTSLTRAKNNS